MARLSGSVAEDRPMTPTRKSRRLSGAGEDDKPDMVKSLLLEDQLAGLGSPSRRTSATARNKRISQLGGAAITTIPEVPEKEVIVEAPIIEEKEPEVDIPEKKEPETKAHEKEVVAVVIKPAVESNFTALKEKEIKDVPEKEEKLTSSNKPAAVADKENHPMVKVLDRIIVAKNIPRQKPKSGKFWKEGRQQLRQIKRDKGKKFTFEQRMKNKEEKMKNKELADLLLNRKALLSSSFFFFLLLSSFFFFLLLSSSFFFFLLLSSSFFFFFFFLLLSFCFLLLSSSFFFFLLLSSSSSSFFFFLFAFFFFLLLSSFFFFLLLSSSFFFSFLLSSSSFFFFLLLSSS